MTTEKENIFNRLQQEILVLQGFKPACGNESADMGLGNMVNAFPNKSFPIATVHEFLTEEAHDVAATVGFVAGLLSAIMQDGKPCVWISAKRTLFPPSLQSFGVAPEQVIFVDLQNEKQALWVMEEALKCEGLAAVIGEIRDISFTASRRLQLAVEKSRVTGFLLRHRSNTVTAIASAARWKIKSLPSETGEGIPGLGFPRWQVALLKIRNGKTGSWKMEWHGGKFRPVYKPLQVLLPEEKRKAG